MNFGGNMDIQKICITSINFRDLSPYESIDRIEQRLTISKTGRVWFTAYTYENIDNERKLYVRDQIFIGKKFAKVILSTIKSYVESNPTIYHSLDSGCWGLNITKVNDEDIYIESSFVGGIFIGSIDISELIRTVLQKDNLLLFDGKWTPESN